MECMSGVLIHQDVVQLPQVQSRNKYFNEVSCLPGDTYATANAAEVLWQVERAKLPPGGLSEGVFT